MAAKQSAPKPSSLRLLILSPSPSDSKSIPPFVPFLEAITGTEPSNEIASFAGYTSHPPLKLRTKYYSSDVSIWCDELPLPASGHGGTVAESRTSSTQVHARNDDDVDDADDSPHAVKAKNPGGSQEETSSPTLADWKSQILSPEAAEVRAVIGGVVLLLPVFSSTPAQSLSQSQSSSSSPPNPHVPLIQALHELREAIEDESPGRDIASLVVLQTTSPAVTKKTLDDHVEKLEETCLTEGHLGWDFIAWTGRPRPDTTDAQAADAHLGAEIQTEDDDTRNEFGEKTGIGRVLEVLEGIDWTASPSFDLDDADGTALDLDLDDLNLSLGDDAEREMPRILRGGMDSRIPAGLDFELEREMMELKMSMLEGNGLDHDDDGNVNDEADEDDEQGQIDELPALLERVVAIREAGAEMGKDERERFAKREIARIMREMG